MEFNSQTPVVEQSVEVRLLNTFKTRLQKNIWRYTAEKHLSFLGLH